MRRTVEHTAFVHRNYDDVCRILERHAEPVFATATAAASRRSTALVAAGDQDLPGFDSSESLLIQIAPLAKDHAHHAWIEFRWEANPRKLDGRGRLLCGACENSSAAASVEVDRCQRLEGAGDAADLMLVALVECPHCGARGSMTLGYGPNSSDADASFLAELDLREASPEPITGATGS